MILANVAIPPLENKGVQTSYGPILPSKSLFQGKLYITPFNNTLLASGIGGYKFIISPETGEKSEFILNDETNTMLDDAPMLKNFTKNNEWFLRFFTSPSGKAKFSSNTSGYPLDGDGSFAYWDDKVIDDLIYLHIVINDGAKIDLPLHYSYHKSSAYNLPRIFGDYVIVVDIGKTSFYNKKTGELVLILPKTIYFAPNSTIKKNSQFAVFGRYILDYKAMKVVGELPLANFLQNPYWYLEVLEGSINVVYYVDHRITFSKYTLSGDHIATCDINVKTTPPDIYHEVSFAQGVCQNLVYYYDGIDNKYKIIDPYTLDKLFEFQVPYGEYQVITMFDDWNNIYLQTGAGLICFDSKKRIVSWVIPLPSHYWTVNDDWLLTPTRTDLRESATVEIKKISNPGISINIDFDEIVRPTFIPINNEIYKFKYSWENHEIYTSVYTFDGKETPINPQKLQCDYIWAGECKNNIFMLVKQNDETALYKIKDNQWEKVLPIGMNHVIKANAKGNLLVLLDKEKLSVVDLETLKIKFDQKGSFHQGIEFWKNFIIACDDKDSDIIDLEHQKVFEYKKLGIYCGSDDEYAYFSIGDIFQTFDGLNVDEIRISETLYDESFMTAVKGLFFSYRRIISTNGKQLQWTPLLSNYYEKYSKVFQKDSDVEYITQDGRFSTSLLFSPCPTFSISRIDNSNNKVTFSFTNTRQDDLDLVLKGEAYLASWGDDGKPPIFTKLDEPHHKLGPLLPGMSQEITFDLPKPQEIDGKKSEGKYFALIIESNGLLDTKNSELSDFDREGRPLFDGTPLSLDKQHALVLTVWKK